MINIDAAVVGGGPAGLAACIKLYKLGIKNLILFERNDKLGGILNQCIHSGFGIDYYKEELTGPEYAVRMIYEFNKLKIPHQLDSMVIDLKDNNVLTVSSGKFGIKKYKAKAVIIATGCRERTRENLEIPGTRPAGIFTAGQAQELINIRNFKIGKNVIIQGSGDIGLIMARRLKIEGYNVIKIFERLPYLSGLIRNKVQCLDDFGIPIEFNCQISDIYGNDRVEYVEVCKLDEKLNPIQNTKQRYECDTVLFSVGLIPEIEIFKKSGGVSNNNFNPSVDSKFQSKIPGQFVCGNALQIHDLADDASVQGEKTAEYIFEYLNDFEKFDSNINNNYSYGEKGFNKDYNEKFFKSLKNKKICIICPKGCILDETGIKCKRGRDFYKKEKICKMRKMTTTVYCKYKGVQKRIPVISESEIDINIIPDIKKQLKKIKNINTKKFSVHLNKQEYFFKAPY